jgi:LuxR family maltose regulon positive regulatory protein
VVAPAGFGKSTLLLQCRQRLAGAWRHRRVAFRAMRRMSPARFTMALRQSLRLAREARATTASHAQRRGRSHDADAGGHSLARHAHGDRRGRQRPLPAATVSEVLQYLLLKRAAQPAVAIGSRVPLPLRTAELAAKGNASRWAPRTCACAWRNRSSSSSGAWAAARPGRTVRLHEVTEGWPIGLQLMATGHRARKRARGRDPLDFRPHGNAAGLLRRTVMAQLPPDIVADLVRVSILDRLDAGSFARSPSRGRGCGRGNSTG